MTTTARRTLRWQAATVLAIRDEAPRVKTFRLRLEHVSDHLPGQYYVLRLTASDSQLSDDDVVDGLQARPAG